MGRGKMPYIPQPQKACKVTEKLAGSSLSCPSGGGGIKYRSPKPKGLVKLRARSVTCAHTITNNLMLLITGIHPSMPSLFQHNLYYHQNVCFTTNFFIHNS